MVRRGFTGTRNPPASARTRVRQLLETLDPLQDELVVGCCLGIDQMVGQEGARLGFMVHGVVPANKSAVDFYYQDYCTSYEHMPYDTNYMDRNARIVEISDDLFAFPLTAREGLRSGTWATIRRGRKKGMRVTIIPVVDIPEELRNVIK